MGINGKYHKPEIVACPRCGTRVNLDKHKYCPKCGTCLECDL